MTLSQDSNRSHISPPKILIQRATPESSQEQAVPSSPSEAQRGGLSPRRTKSLGIQGSPSCQGVLSHSRKRSATTADLVEARKDGDMASRSPRLSPDKVQKNTPLSPSSSSSKRTKSSPKEVDWAEVTDPEERRRIQNRIAQRKFREPYLATIYS
jgi:hypothetical protein